MNMVESFEGVCCYAFRLYEMVESFEVVCSYALYYKNDWSYKPFENLLIDV